MITWNLQAVFKARGIEKPFTFLVKAGLANHTAHSILRNPTFKIRLTHLEIICARLNCTPNDLLRWNPDPANPLPAEHQLFKIKSKEKEFDLIETLNTIPIEKLNQIATMLSNPNP
jgi:DNA-binding Xre family transcriptional regulator